MAIPSVTKFFNGRIVQEEGLFEKDIFVQQGKFIHPQSSADFEIDLKGAILSPGYIDLQLNGAFGFDLSSDIHCVDEVAKKLPQYGVTAFLPTLISSSLTQYQQLIPALQPHTSEKSAEVLGIHLEGPFFNLQDCGAHNVEAIKWAQEMSWLEVYTSLDGVKMVTMAPEIPFGLERIQELAAKGINVMIGHSNASYSETEKAIKAGAKGVTHLYNVMTPFHHRNPGIIGYVLTHPEIFYSVIADGVHLHDAALLMAWKANPQGLFLVSDAMQALGLPPGSYQLGKTDVDVKMEKAFVKGTQTLAGSILSLDATVRNLRRITGCSIVEAIGAATWKPARIIGIDSRKGSIKIGYDADFLLLNDHLDVQACYIAGQQAYVNR